jgi:TRAP-type mannitol/chloroaromatic compound transport system permease small subunit
MSTDGTARMTERRDLPIAIRVSDGLRSFVDFVGRWGSWLILPLVLVTVFDVVARKLVWIQIWLVENVSRVFESTLLQELEWHVHTALFTLVLGYGYIYNTHVRVDLVRETLSFRKKAWLELIGLSFFLLPYCAIVIYFASVYAYDSFMIGEISASQVGLSHRWIIKSVLVFGLVVAVISGIAVWLQVAIVLWGPKDIRFPLMTLEWPEEEGSKIEGKERIKLEELEEATWDVETETLRKATKPSPVGTAD